VALTAGWPVRGRTALTVVSIHLRYGLSSSGNWDEQPRGYAKGLFVPAAERVAVCRLQKPSVFSIRGWPEHKVSRQFDADFGPLGRERPLWSGSDHELEFIGQREGFFEYEVGIPAALCACTSSLNVAPKVETSERERPTCALPFDAARALDVVAAATSESNCLRSIMVFLHAYKECSGAGALGTTARWGELLAACAGN
jgi:hypothetical protein